VLPRAARDGILALPVPVPAWRLATAEVLDCGLGGAGMLASVAVDLCQASGFWHIGAIVKSRDNGVLGITPTITMGYTPFFRRSLGLA
jgi:hypothetical protein